MKLGTGYRLQQFYLEGVLLDKAKNYWGRGLCSVGRNVRMSPKVYSQDLRARLYCNCLALSDVMITCNEKRVVCLEGVPRIRDNSSGTSGTAIQKLGSKCIKS